MKQLLTCLFLFLSFNLIAQDDFYKQKIINSYVNELKLDEKQATTFSEIFIKYDKLFKNEELSAGEFNKINKQRSLEFFQILSHKQFSAYKKIKKEIEPSLNYRFD